MSPFVRPELICTTDQVAHLAPGRIRLVDCRFRFESDAAPEYLEAHLPGAIHCDWSRDLSTPPPVSGHPRWMLASAAEFERVMARLGISNDTIVVAYDAEGGHHAARLWLGLRRYGHDACAIMEGGIQKWIAEERPLERGAAHVAAGRFVAYPQDGVIATKEEVLSAVGAGDPRLLDVRRGSEYAGTELRSARGGHIPGAVNVFWRNVLRDDWTFKDDSEIEAMYASAGFGPETRTITYCQGGVRAAFTHLVLMALGRKDVRTYDGSWEEWGNDPSLPVATEP